MLICWSGGADSTLLLAESLEHERLRFSIRTIGISVAFSSLAREQRRARLALRERLMKIHRGGSWPHVELVVNEEFDERLFSLRICNSPGSTQPALWMLGALPYVEPGEALALAYLEGELDTRAIRLQDAFAALQEIRECGGSGLIFPFERRKKVDVIRALRDRGLLEHTWTCEGVEDLRGGEDPMTEPCGRCSPCSVRTAAVEAIARADAAHEAAMREKYGSVTVRTETPSRSQTTKPKRRAR